LTFALLALAPFPLFVLQTYGGEMVLRIYLFALPFMAFFAAAFFFATPTSSSSWYTTLGVGAASVILLCGFLVARYGNEKMDYFTPEEVAAVTYFYEVAPPRASLIIGSWNMPRRFQDYEKHDFIELRRIRQWRDSDTDDSMDGVLQGIEQLMRAKQAQGSYILITQSQKDEARLLRGGQTAYDRLTRLQQALLQSSAYKLIYSNSDATLFTLATTRPEPAQ